MDNSYTYAHVSRPDELVMELTRYEKELSAKLGSNIVLVAFTNDANSK